MLSGDDDDGEYEEQLVYLHFEGMKSMAELFAQPQSNDFLIKEPTTSEFRNNDPKLLDPKVVQNNKSGLVWNENLRMAHCKTQKLNDNVLLKFHNLESDMPVLQLGNRYYTGKSKPPLGTQLFFQKTSSSTSLNGADQPSTSSSSIRGSKQLQSLLNQNPNVNGGIQSIPKDEIFNNISCNETYDLVAKTDKVISFNLRRSENRSHLRQQYLSQQVCDPLDISANDGQSMNSRNEGPSGSGGKDNSKRISNLRKMISGTYVKRRSPLKKFVIRHSPPASTNHPEIETEQTSSLLLP